MFSLSLVIGEMHMGPETSSQDHQVQYEVHIWNLPLHCCMWLRAVDDSLSSVPSQCSEIKPNKPQPCHIRSI